MNQLKITVSLLGLTALLLFTGCGTTAKFVYPADMAALAKFTDVPAADKTVAVIPFDDYRKANNSSTGLFLAFLPLVPYGWVEYDRPDAAEMFLCITDFRFTPSEDLAKAAALSLRQSGLFKDAYFSYGGDKDRADFVLSGRIDSTRYTGRLFSYGLSFCGDLLWLIGLPAGNSSNELILTIQLKRQNKLLWEYRFKGSDSTCQGYYYHWGHDVKAYSELMQQAMNEAMNDLAVTIQKNPNLLSIPGK